MSSNCVGYLNFQNESSQNCMLTFEQWAAVVSTRSSRVMLRQSYPINSKVRESNRLRMLTSELTNIADFSLGLRPLHFAPLLGSGIFTQDGAAWNHSRALLRPQFTSNRSQNFEEIKACVESLLQQVPTGGVIDLQPLFFKLTFDTSTFLLFCETMSSLASSEMAGQEL